MAMRPLTSPTTFIGGFTLGGCSGTPTDTLIVRKRLELLELLNANMIICENALN